MLRKVYLHGALGAKYGDVFELNIATAGEAVRALAANFPTFLKDIRDGAWHVVRGKNIDDGFSLGKEEIAAFNLGSGDLHFIPHVAGSKRSGVMKLVIGIVLIASAFTFGLAAGGMGTALAATGVLSGVTYGNMAMLGVALALSGASSLLAGENKKETTEEEASNSFTFSGPGNAYSQGSPVPLVYGEIITGGVMISGGVDVERIAPSNGGYGSGLIQGGGGKK